MTLQTESPSDVEISEGRARLLVRSLSGSANGGVFYNPAMSLNRDLAVLFASSYFRRPIRVCDAMTASGIRATRYALELPHVTSVIAADRESQTVEAARRTVELNNLKGKITVTQSDANLFLSTHLEDRFDLTDLDPFGSPAPFFESALRATLDGGVVASTATDMAPLTGARRAACIRKYGIWPIRTEFQKENAVRIVAACIAITAGRLQLGTEIVFAHATDHYARIYASVARGRSMANLSSRSLGFLEYCPKCLRRDTHTDLEDIETKCEACGAKTNIGGPLWLGRIWDRRTVESMIARTPNIESSRASELQRILALINEECNAPAFYYTTDVMSENLRIKPPSIKRLLEALRAVGFQASRTHFNPVGFRTDASGQDLLQVIRSSAQET